MSAPPFSCQYNPAFAQVLHQLNLSLALSTYQAGKVVLISPQDEQRIIQLPRTFRKAMGLALHQDRMAIATLDEVIVLRNSSELAQHYPQKPGVYDSMYMPRATFHTGALDIHDLEWGKDGLYAVNTIFSCLCRIDALYNFTPIWQPPFVSKLAAEDRCHLNGMAMQNGQPAFATAFNQGDQPKSWREDILKTGIVMRVPDGQLIAEGLAMPHSPRLYPEGLFVLESGRGQLTHIDLDSGKTNIIFQHPGFLRGMDRYGDYLFIGVSQVRASSKTFAKIDDRFKQSPAGILVVHLPSGKLVGQLAYQASVEEIYDVKVLPQVRRPNILSTLQEDYKLGLTTPFATYWGQTTDSDIKQ
ncbi:MAG: TIGR03032 family protein [Bacteroidota bacterium]